MRKPSAGMGTRMTLSEVRPALPQRGAAVALAAAVLTPSAEPSMATHQVERRTVPRHSGVPLRWLFDAHNRPSRQRERATASGRSATLAKIRRGVGICILPWLYYRMHFEIQLGVQHP
jgi:hypothetical protein